MTVVVVAAVIAFVGIGTAFAVRRGAILTATDLSAGFALGAALMALLVLSLAALGARGWVLPVVWTAYVAIGIAICARRVADLRRAGSAWVGALRRSSWQERGTAALLVGAIALFVWKSLAVPLWSWDHFAIWGVKAREMATGGLDLGFLADPLARPARTDHPLGLPALWIALAFPDVPDASIFKLAHLLFGLALALCFAGAARRLGANGWGANLLTTVLVLSPLYADSEGLGLAEIALALWSCAAIAWMTRAASRRAGIAAGLALGFLPWLKQEGWTLALFLLIAVVAAPLGRRGSHGGARRFARVALPALGLALAAIAFQRFVLPADAGFLAGDWRTRAGERLPELPQLWRLAASELAAVDWLGFWWALPLVTALSLVWRRRRAALLAAVVWTQAALYFAICYLSPAPAANQLLAAFFRTCAALVPLGLLACAALVARPAPRIQARVASPAP